jgi:hypothetical protein
MVLGENANGLTQQPASTFKPRIVQLYQPKFDLWAALFTHMSQIDTGYDYAGLFGMILVELARRAHWHRAANPFASKRRAWCSEFVTEVLQSVQPALLAYTLLTPATVDPWELKELVDKDAAYFTAVGNSFGELIPK